MLKGHSTYCILASLIAGGFALTAGTAHAAQERMCAKQYSMEEQLILEWAALGGDPHAQLALAQCAAPNGQKKFTDAEKNYAVKWLVLATCDAEETEANLERNVRTRQLKEDGDLSFRRFGGKIDREKFSTRDKMFQAYRERRREEVSARYSDFTSSMTPAEIRSAKDAMIDEFSRMGPLGLLRLSELSACSAFDAEPAFTAASWSAAAQAWSGSDHAAVYGKSDKRKWSVSKESKTQLDKLTADQTKTVAFEKNRLLRTSDSSIDALENQAALADLQNLQFSFAHAEEEGGAPRTVTTAVQYALESLGYISFVNGPDNDYGPSTIEAVKKMQTEKGLPVTRWLTHGQARDTICQAAVTQGDPVSLFNISLMYANGWGYKQDLNRAKRAIEMAETRMTAELANADELAEWKLDNYPDYDTQIKIEKAAINAAWADMPEHEKPTPTAQLELCR